MKDRFVGGVIAGFSAGVVQVLLDYGFLWLKWSKIVFPDYAAILIYDKKATFWWDTFLSIFVFLNFSAILGVVFAYLTRLIGTKYYLFKGWFYAVSIWFIVSAVGTMYRVPILEKTPWQTATTQTITSSVFGILIALILSRLLKEKSWSTWI